MVRDLFSKQVSKAKASKRGPGHTPPDNNYLDFNS